MEWTEDDHKRLQAAEQLCRRRGIRPGFRMMDASDGPSVLSRVSGTGYLICHPEGDPDMQSSWAMTPEEFEKRYLT